MEKTAKIFLVVFLIINILAVDGFLYGQWNQKKSCPDPVATAITVVPTVVPTIMPTVALTPTARIIVKTQTPEKKSTQYLPIPGNGSTLENKWVDLLGTEFYISTDDYPNLKGAYFEANMKLVNGNGLAYLRLFDITSGIEVWGSEISTSSQNFTSVSSGKLTIRSGTHLYRVQAKSLTADTTVFNSGRIKIILEN